MSKKGPHAIVHTILSTVHDPVEVGRSRVEVLLEAGIHHLVTGTYLSCDRRMTIEIARTKKTTGRIVPAKSKRSARFSEDETQKRCSQPSSQT
jgi:hypothetical protein